MALYIMYDKKHPATEFLPKQVEWLVGHDPNTIRSTAAIVMEVNASGKELDRIRELMPNIPCAKGDHCTWYGDLAKFVAANIL